MKQELCGSSAHYSGPEKVIRTFKMPPSRNARHYSDSLGGELDGLHGRSIPSEVVRPEFPPGIEVVRLSQRLEVIKATSRATLQLEKGPASGKAREKDPSLPEL